MSNAERDAWDAKVEADIRYARALVREAWTELGIAEPADKLAYARELIATAQAELPDRR
jgi:hypothetical protein